MPVFYGYKLSIKKAALKNVNLFLFVSRIRSRDQFSACFSECALVCVFESGWAGVFEDIS